MPIGIEIVRGSDSEDKWRVQIDGLRCEHEMTNDPGQDTPTCVLPPPFDPTAAITQQTSVRPLAVGVRLEDEAMAPAKVELVIEQVVHSTERVANCDGRENEVLEIRRVEVTPYRSSDITAKAATLPYPFCAVAQSAIAIVSFKEIEKYAQRFEAMKQHNQGIQNDYDNDERSWKEERISHRMKETEKKNNNKRVADEDKAALAAWEDELIGYQARMQAYRQAGSAGPAPRQPGAKPKAREPEVYAKFSKDKPVQKASKPFPERPGDDTRHYIIGGGQLSAAAALTPYFKQMTRACIATRSSEDEEQSTQNQNYGSSVQIHLQAMRRLMSVQSNIYGLAVFDTLMTGTPSPLSTYLVNDVYNVNPETGEVTAKIDTPDGKEKRLQEIKDSVGNDMFKMRTDYPNGSQFVYDRVPLNDRFSTSTRIRIAIEITEYASGPVRRIMLEPRRYDAIRAHAVYSGLRKDVDDLEAEMKEFVTCLFGLQEDRGSVLGSVDAFRDRFGRVTNFTRRQLSRIRRLGGLLGEVQNARLPPNLDPKQVETFMQELSLIMNLIVPIPEIMSVEQQEQILVLVERDEVQKEEIAFQAQLQEQLGGPDEEVPLGTPLTVKANSDESDEELSDALKSRALVRELPQIVGTGTDLVAGLQFQKPVDTATPDEFHQADQAAVGGWMYLLSFTVSFAWLVGEQGVRWNLFTLVSSAETLLQLLQNFGVEIVGGAGEAGAAAAAAGGAGAAAAGGAAAGGAVLGGIGVGAAGAFAAALIAGKIAKEAAKGLGKIYLNAAKDQVRAFGLALPNAWWAGNMVREWSRQANQISEEKKAAYLRAVTAGKGIPIETSLAAGKEALRQIRELVTRRSTALRQAGGVTVLFDESSKERFRFFERYTISPKDLEAVLASQPVYEYDMWQRVPNTSTLTLLPPADVLDTLFEVETLRAVPIGDAVKRVAGKSIALSADQSVELSAETAFQEILEYVIAARFPLAEYKGGQLLQNTEEMTLTILERAARIMKAAYGSQPGVTLITGDDPLWSCLPSGVAARMALRHITTFVRADAAVQAAGSGEERFAASLEHWQLPQRSLIDAFANSLVASAKKAVMESAKPMPRPYPNARGVVIEAVRSFARMTAMADPSDKVPAMMTAAHYCGTLQVAFTSNAAAASILSIASSESVAAGVFQDQKDIKYTVRALSQQVMNAAWASRRVDKNVMLSWKVAQTSLAGRNRVDDLIAELSGLGIQNEKRQYYAPFGVRLSGLPGTTPFDVYGMERVVWLEPLRRALSSLALGVSSTYFKQNTPTIRGVPVSALKTFANDLVGLSRHPLILSSIDDEVTVPQAVLEEVEESFTVEGTPDSVVEAARILLSSTDAGNAISIRATAARVMAFNADRLTAAIDLYCAGSAIGKPANVLLPSGISVLAHCIAVALHESERSGMNHEMYLHVDTDAVRDAARARASYAIGVCERALEKGCKVVSLPELCAVLCHK